ncbi:MAG TPA: hypothetical protein DCY61_04355 [Dehalococcoidia bacterium]|nr:hypothetical protein [Dehalococcoidia bacterium]
MGAALVLGLVSLVVIFIIGILSAFPIDSTTGEAAIPPSNYQDTQDFSVDAVEEAGERFLFSYNSVIEDLVSFQRDPSLERAEARRDALISYAGNVQERFEGLSHELRERLDQLTTSSKEGSE